MSRHRDLRNIDPDDYEDVDVDFGSPPSHGTTPTANAYLYNPNAQTTIADIFGGGGGEEDGGQDPSLGVDDEGYAPAHDPLYQAHANDYDAFYGDDFTGQALPSVPTPPPSMAVVFASEKSSNKKKRKKKNKNKNKNNKPVDIFAAADEKKPVNVIEAPVSSALVPEELARAVTVKREEVAAEAAADGADDLYDKDESFPTPPTTKAPSPAPGLGILRRQVSGKDEKLAQRQDVLRAEMLAAEEKERDEADEDDASRKERLNMVVIGHVDAGKSTLMGHLLFKMGRVDQRAMHKFEKQSRESGKASFKFAWVLDAHAEERNRGITVDVAVNFFETTTKKVTLLDAPGHRDFVPNMISGAAQADCAILVVPATRGEFETSFAMGGQTKEHAILARSLGVGQLVVAVNKLDQADWSEERFEEIRTELSSFLKLTGFKDRDVRFVPVSGLAGENIVERKSELLSAWYDGPTLVEMIDTFRTPKRHVDKPFRLCVSDVFRSQMLGTAVAGKVEAGTIMVGETVMVMPLRERAVVKSIMRRGTPAKISKAGDNVEIGLKDLADDSVLSVGQFLCALERPVPLVKKFRAQIVTLDIRLPISKGLPVVMYAHSVSEPAVITRLVNLLDKTTGEVKRYKNNKKIRPRHLTRNVSATIEVELERETCMELYADFRPLGRFSLRRGTETVAAGIVTRFVEATLSTNK